MFTIWKVYVSPRIRVIVGLLIELTKYVPPNATQKRSGAGAHWAAAEPANKTMTAAEAREVCRCISEFSCGM
jgi:hypothetical protein